MKKYLLLAFSLFAFAQVASASTFHCYGNYDQYDDTCYSGNGNYTHYYYANGVRVEWLGGQAFRSFVYWGGQLEGWYYGRYFDEGISYYYSDYYHTRPLHYGSLYRSRHHYQWGYGRVNDYVYYAHRHGRVHHRRGLAARRFNHHRADRIDRSRRSAHHRRHDDYRRRHTDHIGRRGNRSGGGNYGDRRNHGRVDRSRDQRRDQRRADQGRVDRQRDQQRRDRDRASADRQRDQRRRDNARSDRNRDQQRRDNARSDRNRDQQRRDNARSDRNRDQQRRDNARTDRSRDQRRDRGDVRRDSSRRNGGNSGQGRACRRRGNC